MTEAAVRAATERWVRETVVGLNLCPFAAAPLHGGRIRYTVCRVSGFEAVYRAFLVEVADFLGLSPYRAETGLFIVPQGLEGFATYLELLDAAEQALRAAGLEGVLQLASFHPDYVFAGTAADDPANYTNRSPYPMLHLIREAGLAAALEGYPDPEAIPVRNARRLRALGLAELERRLAACRGPVDG
jgi:hypothetical protein